MLNIPGIAVMQVTSHHQSLWIHESASTPRVAGITAYMLHLSGTTQQLQQQAIATVHFLHIATVHFPTGQTAGVDRENMCDRS